MYKIFWGWLLRYFLVMVNLKFELIPTFISYALILWGLQEMSQESEYFKTTRVPAGLLLIISVLNFISALSPLSWLAVTVGQISQVTGFLSILCEVWVLFSVANGVMDMEKHYQRDLNGGKLHYWWRRYLVLRIVTWLAALVLLPMVFLLPLVGSVLGLVVIAALLGAVAVEIIVLVQLYRAAKACHEIGRVAYRS